MTPNPTSRYPTPLPSKTTLKTESMSFELVGMGGNWKVRMETGEPVALGYQGMDRRTAYLVAAFQVHNGSDALLQSILEPTELPP